MALLSSPLLWKLQSQNRQIEIEIKRERERGREGGEGISPPVGKAATVTASLHSIQGSYTWDTENTSHSYN